MRDDVVFEALPNGGLGPRPAHTPITETWTGTEKQRQMAWGKLYGVRLTRSGGCACWLRREPCRGDGSCRPDSREWFDHGVSLIASGVRLLMGQPYGISGKALERLEDFCRENELEIASIGDLTSYWCPGRTVAIVVLAKKP